MRHDLNIEEAACIPAETIGGGRCQQKIQGLVYSKTIDIAKDCIAQDEDRTAKAPLLNNHNESPSMEGLVAA